MLGSMFLFGPTLALAFDRDFGAIDEMPGAAKQREVACAFHSKLTLSQDGYGMRILKECSGLRPKSTMRINDNANDVPQAGQTMTLGTTIPRMFSKHNAISKRR